MATPGEASANIDPKVVEGFGREWSAYDQTPLKAAEYDFLFHEYFDIFPFGALPDGAEGFDLGCGSGRWAEGVLARPRIGILHCIDPSPQALDVARKRLGSDPRARFHEAASDTIPLPDGSQDFGYSLGVLHHIPDTRAALADCVRKLKPGAPFLVYLYYSMDNKPRWYRGLWRLSDVGRRLICRLPFPARRGVSTALASAVYWPLARGARLGEQLGLDVSNFPLGSYRGLSFYTMRTDALDRFGTRLEQRFSRQQIESMLRDAGLGDIKFSEREPFWVACGRRES